MIFVPPSQFGSRSKLNPLLVAASLLCASIAAAQPASPPAADRDRDFLIASTEQKLWLVSSKAMGDRRISDIFCRNASGDFEQVVSTTGNIAAAVAVENSLLAFFDDNIVYRYFPDQPQPLAERVLPAQQTPLDIAGALGRVFAIVRAPAAEKLPEYDWEAGAPTSQPFESKKPRLSIAIYDGHDWAAAASLPADVVPADDSRLGPKICVRLDKLLLFAAERDGNRVDCCRLDTTSREWIANGSVQTPRLAGFWAVEYGKLPTLVIAVQHPADGAVIKAFRLIVNSADSGAEWRPAELRLSDLPDGASLAGYEAATAFNQHIVLLARDSAGDAYLRFASLTDAPAETTIPLSKQLSELSARSDAYVLFQVFTLALLVVLMASLFIFRRGSMMNQIPLPPGCALALSMQRILAWLIDFAPFTLAAAALLGIRWGDGLAALARWGVARAPSDGPPADNILIWWAFSVGGHTLYMLIMELISRRTVGKVLARVYLMSETGARAKVWQILVRNLARLLEFLPQFWIFAILVILSRNHQRVGDVLARTVAIRIVPRPPVEDLAAGLSKELDDDKSDSEGESGSDNDAEDADD